MILIIQLILTIITTSMAVMAGKYYQKSGDASSTKLEQKYGLYSTIFIIITTISLIYFCIFIFASDKKTENAAYSIILFLLTSIGIGEVALYYSDPPSKTKQFITMAVISVILGFTVLLVGSVIDWGIETFKYESNYTYIEEVEYSKEEYLLLDEFDENAIEDKYEDFKFISEYIVYDKNNNKYAVHYNIEKDGKKETVYKEYDYDDYDYSITIVNIKNDEKPFLEIKKYTKYAMDNNLEIPEKVVAEEKVALVFHIASKDIQKILELEDLSN